MSDGGLVPMQTSREGHKEDAQLFRRMTRGDGLACSQIYDRFSGPLYSLARRILDDAAEAESVVQEVFVSLAENARSSPQDRGSLFRSLVELTRLRALRRVNSRRERLAPLSGEIMESAIDRSVTETTTADPAAVSALPPDELRTLELAYFGGLSVQEISSRLNEPREHVTARLHRAIFKLRHSLGPS